MLSNLQTNPEPYLRMEATIALWRINRQPSLVLPVLVDALSKTADPSKWEIFQAMGEMGADAKDAVPAIIKELKSQNSEVRQRAAEALWRIDPKQAPLIVDALVEPLDNPKATHATLFSVVEGVRLLGEIGPEARRAVSALIKHEAHTYPPASNAVAKTLLLIDRDGVARGNQQ